MYPKYQPYGAIHQPGYPADYCQELCRCYPDRVRDEYEKLKKKSIITDAEKELKESTTILDPIHGNIPIEPWAQILLNTCYMQRLKRVSTLGFSDLVFPGAHHSRFEHSLGTYFIAKKILASKPLKRKKLTPDAKFCVKLAALLHDIGHGPFSHRCDNLAGKVFKKLITDCNDLEHVSKGASIINDQRSCLNKILKRMMVKGCTLPCRSEVEAQRILEGVAKMIRGKPPDFGPPGIEKLIDSQLDVDKLDYLVRDSYFSGVPTGGYDLDRICANIDVQPNGITVDAKADAAVFSFLMGRSIAYHSIIYHHAVEIAHEMVIKAMWAVKDDRNLLRNDKIKILDGNGRFLLREMDDSQFMNMLFKMGEFPARIATALQLRRLYKLAYGIRAKEGGELAFGDYKEVKCRRCIEMKLARRTNIDIEDILVVHYEKFPEIKMQEISLMFKNNPNEPLKNIELNVPRFIELRICLSDDKKKWLNPIYQAVKDIFGSKIIVAYDRREDI